jgi:NADPH:quinone reductase-like Zn-dependent oxidoreductase
MKNKMYVTDGRGNLDLTGRPIPELKSHDVLVKIAAVSLNFRDIPFIKGNATRQPSLGRIPFSDAVGRVEAIGDRVERVRVGDRVSPTILPNWIDGPLTPQGLSNGFGSAGRDGLMTEFLVVEDSALVKVPDYLSDQEAATLPCAALTAWHALVEVAAISPNEVVVIETTGGVAMFAAQIAVAMDLKTVLTSRSEVKLAKARELGVWQTINSVEFPDWDERVLALTDARGARLVLDMGLRDGLPRSCRAASFEGTVAIIGVVEGWKTVFEIAPVMNKNLRVRGVETGSRAMFERMNAFFEQKQIRPIISKVFNFGEVDAALDELGRSPFGKVVINLASG